LETKLSDKTWTDKFEADDLKLITDIKDVAENLISQVYIFIDYFHQYVDIVQASAIFSPEYNAAVSNNAEVYPTQTSAPAPSEHPSSMSGNRAERRKKKEPSLIVPEKKLIVP
jgi:hypothetical protein